MFKRYLIFSSVLFLASSFYSFHNAHASKVWPVAAPEIKLRGELRDYQADVSYLSGGIEGREATGIPDRYLVTRFLPSLTEKNDGSFQLNQFVIYLEKAGDLPNCDLLKNRDVKTNSKRIVVEVNEDGCKVVEG